MLLARKSWHCVSWWLVATRHQSICRHKVDKCSYIGLVPHLYIVQLWVTFSMLTHCRLSDSAVISGSISQHTLTIDIMSISSETAHSWISQDFTNEKSTSVQVVLMSSITEVKVDQILCQYMASLGHNELRNTFSVHYWWLLTATWYPLH